MYSTNVMKLNSIFIYNLHCIPLFRNKLFCKTIHICHNEFIQCNRPRPNYNLYFKQHYLRMSSEAKSKIYMDLDKDVEYNIKEKKYRPKFHPGVHKIECVHLPTRLQVAISEIQKDYDKDLLFKDSQNLFHHIQKRQAAVDDQELRDKKRIITEKLIQKGVLPTLAENYSINEEDLPDKEQRKLKKALICEIYNWKALEYSDYKSVVYLTARMAPDFAALTNIFSEIKKRVELFRPQTLFDFGSGVGSVTWAMESVWPGLCKEAYYVDSSPSMNTLSEQLIKEAYPSSDDDDNDKLDFGPKTKYYRQFLPASSNIQYDLVVSSRSLFEVGKMSIRARTVDILWKKVNAGGFLVLVEDGTMEGHRVLMEARDFLSELYKSNSSDHNAAAIHVFSPCSHDKFCPRIFHPSKKPCFFPVEYQPLHVPTSRKDYYSFVVFRKSARPNDDPSAHWPRIVQPVIKNSRMVITRICCSSGQLREKIISKGKNTDALYQVAKRTNWGDCLPVTIDEQHILPTSEE